MGAGGNHLRIHTPAYKVVSHQEGSLLRAQQILATFTDGICETIHLEAANGSIGLAVEHYIIQQ